MLISGLEIQLATQMMTPADFINFNDDKLIVSNGTVNSIICDCYIREY